MWEQTARIAELIRTAANNNGLSENGIQEIANLLTVNSLWKKLLSTERGVTISLMLHGLGASFVKQAIKQAPDGMITAIVSQHSFSPAMTAKTADLFLLGVGVIPTALWQRLCSSMSLFFAVHGVSMQCSEQERTIQISSDVEVDLSEVLSCLFHELGS